MCIYRIGSILPKVVSDYFDRVQLSVEYFKQASRSLVRSHLSLGFLILSFDYNPLTHRWLMQRKGPHQK